MELVCAPDVVSDGSAAVNRVTYNPQRNPQIVIQNSHAIQQQQQLQSRNQPAMAVKTSSYQMSRMQYAKKKLDFSDDRVKHEHGTIENQENVNTFTN